MSADKNKDDDIGGAVVWKAGDDRCVLVRFESGEEEILDLLARGTEFPKPEEILLNYPRRERVIRIDIT